VSDYATVCAYAAGPKGSGKTQALWDLFISRAPRRLSIDFTGEMTEKYNPQALDVYSLTELKAVLRRCASYQRWHVALSMPKAQLQEAAPELARMLNPSKTSSEHRSFSREVGGVAIDCSEAAHWLPNGRSHPDTLEFVQGGRHNRIHLLLASQTPAAVATEVRNAADYFLAFRTQEHTVWKFWSTVASPAVADMVAELPLYHCAYFVKAEQAIYVMDERRRVLRRLDYRARAL
jgi:hypothetical protein